MIGQYVMTYSDLALQTTIPDSIGVGGYPVDVHLVHVVNANGKVETEIGGSGPGTPISLYPIAYRSLTPQASQATNLLVTVDVSALHVAYDSLRVEVTYMIMGQAAGAAASLAIDGNSTVQGVSYSALSAQLLSDGAVLTPPQNRRGIAEVHARVEQRERKGNRFSTKAGTQSKCRTAFAQRSRPEEIDWGG